MRRVSPLENTAAAAIGPSEYGDWELGVSALTTPATAGTPDTKGGGRDDSASGEGHGPGQGLHAVTFDLPGQ